MKVGACTPSVRFAVAVMLPDVPVMMSGYCPIAAVPLAVNVKVLLFVVGLGENEAVTPLGKPAMDRVTLPVKPF